MPEPDALTAADHFVISGDGIDGTVDTSSITGGATGSITVDGVDAQLKVSSTAFGWSAEGPLESSLDGPSRSVTAILPNVGLRADEEDTVEGVALVVTSESNIGGTWMVAGPHQHYDVRSLSIAASVIQS